MTKFYPKPMLVKSIRKTLIIFFASLLFVGNIFAQPSITSFSPVSGAAGTTVTLSGANFSGIASNNIVFFGPVKAAVSAATTSSLTVTVPRGAAYQPVSVTTNYLTAYSSKPFIPVFSGAGPLSSGSFTSGTNMITHGPAISVMSDLDGDGMADLISVNVDYRYLDSVSIGRNTSSPGAISFVSALQFVLAGTRSTITTGDINGDGKPDLVVVNGYRNSISVYTNTSVIGHISFDAGNEFATGNIPTSVAMADLDGDDKPDLIVSNSASGTCSVLRNIGVNGTISFMPKSDFTTGGQPLSLSVSDFDGDNKPDIAVGGAYPGNLYLIKFYKNNSNPGTITCGFVAQYSIPKGNLRQISTGDFNGDGKQDLAVINDSSSLFYIFKNIGGAGTISFTTQPDAITSQRALDFIVGDLNGDSKPDIGFSTSTDLSILQNTSDTNNISFAGDIVYSLPLGAYNIAIGDLDGDGRTDLAGINYFTNSVSFLRNTMVSAGPVPHISYILPDSAKEGDTVNIVGTGLTGAISIDFGGIAATSYSVVSDTIIRAVVGTGASGNIILSTANGTASFGGFGFISTVPPPIYSPLINTFTPDSAQTGTPIVIRGLHFTGLTAVQFGGTNATSFTLISDSSISAILGAGASGSVKIITANGTDSLNGFVFIPIMSSPSVQSFTPISGHAGTTVIITGHYFTGATAVGFGGTPATSFTVLSDSSISAMVGIGTSGTVSVNIGNVYGSLGGFTFVSPPQMTGFTPTTGTQGTMVNITGWNFANATDVRFGGIAASAFTVMSDSSIFAVVGTGASGSVLVSTPDGVDSIGGFSFTKSTLIFPNPAIGFVTVNLSNTTTATQIILTDLSGRLVRTVNISPNISQASVNLAGLIPGVYLLMWRDGVTAKKQLLLVR